MVTTIAEYASTVANAIRELEHDEIDNKKMLYFHIDMKSKGDELIPLIVNDLEGSSYEEIGFSQFYLIKWNNHLYSFGFSINDHACYTWYEETQDYVKTFEQAICEISKFRIVA